jgi:two-component system, cell cycle response regulator
MPRADQHNPVVEDKETIRDAIVRVLAEQADGVVEADTAEEALDLLRTVSVERSRLERENRDLLEHLQRSRDELDRVNAQLQDMANRDGLTGLYNARFFRGVLEQELSRSRRHQRSFGLLLADVDHFKSYNERHGQLAGDDLLRTAAKLLSERCRATTVAARYTGKGFALLTPENPAAGACQFAELLRALFEQYSFPGAEVQPGGRVTLSLGVATYPEAGDDAALLIDRASQALARAKSRGRNQVALWEPPRTGL